MHGPTRRSVLFSSAAPLAAAIHTQQRRNILLLIADDLGLHTGAYGDHAARTPNLDRLATEGVRFTNAFCTTASCSPCRSVILSGLHNHANGQYGLAHAAHNQGYREFVRPLPQVLKDTGFRTGLIGKLHVNPASAFPWDYQPPVNTRNVLEMAGKARDFFRAAAGRPWYLHVGFGDPHRAQQGFANRDYPGVTRLRFEASKVPVPSFLPDKPETRAELAEYYESANRMDQGAGFILEALREAGQVENTLVLFVSDNGIAFPNAKTNVYDSGTHLPMIVRSPAQRTRGLVNHAMASFTDIFPTLVDWAGVRPPDYPLHGRSLLPVLEESDPSGWDRVYFSHTFHEITMLYPMRGVRTRRYKYIRNLFPELEYPHASDLWASATWQAVLRQGAEAKLGQRPVSAYLRRPAEELYEFAVDPDEVRNLADRGEFRQALLSLRAEVQEWRTRTNDPWLILDQYRSPLP